jgi:hypothetical protein
VTRRYDSRSSLSLRRINRVRSVARSLPPLPLPLPPSPSESVEKERLRLRRTLRYSVQRSNLLQFIRVSWDYCRARERGANKALRRSFSDAPPVRLPARQRARKRNREDARVGDKGKVVIALIELQPSPSGTSGRGIGRGVSEIRRRRRRRRGN